MLTLYVLPPAFGLPSIDAQCLATVTYMKHAVPRQEWEVVSDVHAVGNGGTGDWRHLPALWDGNVQISGYLRIVEYLRKVSQGAWDLRGSEEGADDAWLLANNVINRLSPLLSLLFYTSYENYTSTIRPAFAESLPFPSSWVLPVNHRRQQEEHAVLAGISVTSKQLSGVAASLVEAPKSAPSDPLSTSSHPLTDDDLLNLHPVEKIPKENSTSAVIETHRSLRELVEDALFVYSGGEEKSDVPSGLDVHTCLLYSHLGLAVAASRAGLPHAWLSSSLQKTSPFLARQALEWLKEDWNWTGPGAVKGKSQSTAFASSFQWRTEDGIASQEKARSLIAGIVQLSGIDQAGIPFALYSRSVVDISEGNAEFTARETKGRALGHEYDVWWLGATGVTMAALGFKAWQEGF